MKLWGVCLAILKPDTQVPDLLFKVDLGFLGQLQHLLNLLLRVLISEERVQAVSLLLLAVVRIVLRGQRFRISPLHLDEVYHVSGLLYLPKQPLIYRMSLDVPQESNECGWGLRGSIVSLVLLGRTSLEALDKGLSLLDLSIPAPNWGGVFLSCSSSWLLKEVVRAVEPVKDLDAGWKILIVKRKAIHAFLDIVEFLSEVAIFCKRDLIILEGGKDCLSLWPPLVLLNQIPF